MANSRAALYLTIPSEGRPDTRYDVELQHPTPAVRLAWRLVKESGEVYDVALTDHGFECSCADWTFRRNGTGQDCRHIAACRAKGLFGPRNLPSVEGAK